MKKIVSLIIAGCLLCSPVYAKSKKKEKPISQTEIKFMDLAWNSTSEEVASKMKDALFDKSREGSFKGIKIIDYKGTIAGDMVEAEFIFSEDGKLIKVCVETEKQDNIISKFHEKSDVLKIKYGLPNDEIRRFDSPYDRSEYSNHFETGVRSKNIFIIDVFRDAAKTFLDIEITEDLTIKYNYESDYFHKVLEERDKKENAAF